MEGCQGFGNVNAVKLDYNTYDFFIKKNRVNIVNDRGVFLAR